MERAGPALSAQARPGHDVGPRPRTPGTRADGCGVAQEVGGVDFLCDPRSRFGGDGAVRRDHVITRPLTDYLRFEFAHYVHNVAAGEDIRILDLTGRENPGLPDQDFWMFDESRVVPMNYRPDGTQISREVFDGDPIRFVEWKRLAVSESVPFSEYVRASG
ncbi:DUF6879 family protein [Kitasatospora sp. NBC_01300]|uniref:DUF6879 family protein n=1 Tax=Kitasatospora sp. NBC_01300 TaxID=2903574 RepID=UPI00352BD919